MPGNRGRLIAILVVALAGLGIWIWQNHADAGNRNQVVSNGTVEADEVEIGAQRSARLVRFEVEEGQSVRKGQILATLDTSELKAQVQQAQGAASLAAARLAEIQKGTRSEEVERAAAQVQQARASVSGAERTLANSRKGFSRRTALKQALNQAETQRKVAAASLEQSQSALAGAEDALKTAHQEFDTTLQLRTNRDTARQAYEAAVAANKLAAAKLQEALNGARPEEITAAEAQVAQATAAVRQAKEDSTNADTDYARTKTLFAGKAASDQQLDAARTRSETTRARLAQAEQTRREADARLTQLRNGTRQEQVDQARAAAEQARATLAGSEKTLRDAEQALGLRLAAQAQLDTASSQRKIAEAQVASARSALAGADLAVRNSRTAYEDALSEKQGVDTAVQGYQSGLAQLQAAEAQLQELRNGATPEQREQAKAQLVQAQGALELAKTQFEQSVIRAPRDGVITKHVARVGEVVSPGATVARLVPLDDVYLTLYVPLTELGKVKLGQDVRITADTYPGKVYSGRVTQISDTPEFTPRNVQTKDERVKLVFQVKVSIANQNRELKPGMPADAQIMLNGTPRGGAAGSRS